MARGIEIHPDVVSGLVPILRDSPTFEVMHDVAEHGNPFFRFAHAAFVATLHSRTQYENRIIEAISTGVESYEVLGANVGEPIPGVFSLSIITNFEQNPNYGIYLAETMEEGFREMIANHPHLAQGLQDLCEARVKDSSPELVAYSLRGAAVMRAAHIEANELWQFEQDFYS